MLRCVLYELYVLASAVQALRFDGWPSAMRYQHPTLGSFDPSKCAENAALVSFRTLHGFFYNPKSGDDFSLAQFAAFYPNWRSKMSSPPQFRGFSKGHMYNKHSIDKFIAHLTWTRINKPMCIPQPKFKRGRDDTIYNAIALCKDAKAIVEDILNAPSFPGLEKDGQGFYDLFLEAMKRMRV